MPDSNIFGNEEVQKIDDKAVDGLDGVANSLAFKVHEIEKHFHNSEQCYGAESGLMSRGAVDQFTVTAGISPAYGTELQIYNGTAIESGSATKKFDLDRIFISAVSDANRMGFFQIYYGTLGTGVVCTFDHTGELVLKNAHGLSNGTKIMFAAGVGGVLPAALDANTVYYIVNKNDNDFQVSLTLGGTAVALADNGTNPISYYVASQTLLTEFMVSMAGTTSDAMPLPIKSPRIACNNRLWMRGKSKTAALGITFAVGVHTYTA